MNDKLKLLVYILIFALVVTGAYIGYKLLTKDTPALKPSADDDASGVLVDFTVEDTGGNGVRLSDKRGKPTVINFWATWCPYCVEEMPVFEEMYKEYGQKVNFMMIDSVDGYQETRKMGEEFIAKNGYTFPVYYDTQMSAARAFGVSGLPITYFASSDGQILYYINGKTDAAVLRRAIEEMLSREQ